MSRFALFLVSFLIAAAVIAGAAYYRYTHPIVQATQPTTIASTLPTTKPATTLAAKSKTRGPTTQLLDILRVNDPKYPTTQRLDEPLDLRYAARIVLDDPVYLDNQSNLWITRPDAPEPFNFLKAAASSTATHVVRDQVAFALWTSTENGKWLPHLIVKNPAGEGYQLVDYDGRRTLADPHHFDWSRALVLYGRRGEKEHIVVPTATGVCAFTFDQPAEEIVQSHFALIKENDKNANDRAIQLVMDVTGVIAYVTNGAGTVGGKGAARFAAPPLPAAKADPTAPPPPQYKWTMLADWPDRLLHVVPLLDGSVIQIISTDEPDKVAFSLNSVAPVEIDRKKVILLVDQLSAGDPEKRDEAFKTLTTFGPGIAPILEKMIEDQPVEAQIRIRQLLKNKIEPSLGSLSVVDSKLRVVNRLPDGGIIFYAEAGVAIPRPDDTPTYVNPAWLSIRPGRAAELLPPALVADLQPDKQKIIAWGLNDYVVLDPVLGPQWYIGNRLEPLLRKQHREFTNFVGIDAAGRWIFRGPPRHRATAPATFATTTTTTSSTGPTSQTALADSSFILHPSSLIIDPRLPDPTPRLPGWELPPSIGKVGWDKDNWPVIYMDVKPNPVPWALQADGWRVIDEKKEKVSTDAKEIPAPKPPPRPTTTTTTHAATTTTSAPSTQDSALSTQDLLLVTSDGTAYYDGRQSLKVAQPDGTIIDWPLPESAVGTAKPTLLRTRGDLLFLFNESGRIVRIRPTPEGDQPFVVEAVFTRQVPSDPSPQRIWLDPADRICIAHSQNRITVLFPIGRIPPSIAEKMRPEDFPPDDDK
jgi:hypothetical protein